MSCHFLAKREEQEDHLGDLQVARQKKRKKKNARIHWTYHEGRAKRTAGPEVENEAQLKLW